MDLIDPTDGEFHCQICGTVLAPLLDGQGTTGDDAARRERKKRMRELQARHILFPRFATPLCRCRSLFVLINLRSSHCDLRSNFDNVLASPKLSLHYVPPHALLPSDFSITLTPSFSVLLLSASFLFSLVCVLLGYSMPAML
jgi:hypothetical protein